jgi:transmembrane sensor
MTAGDQRTFEAWIEADPANRAAYDSLERLWGSLGAAVDDPQLMAVREADARKVDRNRHLRWAGIAATIAAVAGAWGLFGDLPGTAFTPLGQAVQTDQRLPNGPAEFRTSVGQRTTVTLPDSSVVTLDTDTVLKLHSSARERLVSLERGRAFFRVAKDPSRPFIVLAAGHRVRAIGTAFDVSVNAGKFEVTLVEGRVKVETPAPNRPVAQTAELQPGQRLAIIGDAPQLHQVDLRTETSWHEGRLSFMRDPISEAVEEMNRYSDRKIVFSEGRVPDKSIIGVFKAGDVERFARAVEMDGFASVTAETDDYIELTAK